MGRIGYWGLLDCGSDELGRIRIGSGGCWTMGRTNWAESGTGPDRELGLGWTGDEAGLDEAGLRSAEGFNFQKCNLESRTRVPSQLKP